MNWIVYKRIRVLDSNGNITYKTELMGVFDGDLNGKQAANSIASKLNENLPEGSQYTYNAMRANDKLIGEMFTMEKIDA